MKKKSLKLTAKLTSFCLILLTLFLVVSLTKLAMADFTVEERILTNSVCPGSTILIQEKITTDTASTFTVTLSGSASRFSVAVPSGFWLEPDEEKTVYIYVTPSSRTVPGSYTLRVNIESQGISKVREYEIIVENCHSTSLTVEPTFQRICACETKQLKLTIKNQGNYLENYRLKVRSPIASWVNLTSETVSLHPGSEKEITAYVSVPCNARGDYEINFEAVGTSEYARASAKASVSVVQCFDYLLSPEKTSYSLCDGEKLNTSIKIKNLGTRDNTYSLMVDAPRWVSIEQKKVSVKKNEEKTLSLRVEPPYLTEGTFTAKITALSDYGKVMKTVEIEFKIERCHGIILTVEKEKDKICNGFSKNYSLTVRNIGKFKDTFDITLEAPEWVSLSLTHLTLNATEERTLTLTASPPTNAREGKNEIIVKVKDPLTKAESEARIELETVSIENCYKPVIETENTTVIIAKDTTTILPLTITNEGIEKATYEISLSGTGIGFCQINPAALSLKPEESEIIYLYIAPPVEIEEGNYFVNIIAKAVEGNAVASKTIIISVTKPTEFEKIEKIEKPEVTGKAVEEKKKISWFAKLISFILRLFRPRTEKINITNVTNITNITEISETKPINRAPVLIKEIPNITIKKNETFTIDLALYFKDPDNDKLTFVVIKPLHIEVKTKGSKVTLIPEKGFEGETKTRFYAFDGKEIASSNPVKITVKS